MIIPKEIDEKLKRRTKLANELMNVGSEIDDWLMRNSFDLESPDLKDATLTGVMMYCEPFNAERVVREAIEHK